MKFVSSRGFGRLALLLGGALLVRLIFTLVFDGLIDDGTYRTISAWEWLRRPFFLEGKSQWPSLNYLLPALAIGIGGDLYWSVRLLYLFIGLTNIGMVYLVARRVGGERAGLLAGLLLAVNPYHIHCSLAGAMSETPYVTFALASLWFVMRYRERAKVLDLVAAAVSVDLATMCRFDGVVWAPICLILVATRAGGYRPAFGDRRAWGSLALFAFICAVYPAIVMSRWYQLYGDPLFFFHRSHAVATAGFREGGHPRYSPLVFQTYTLIYWLASSFVILTPVVAAVSLVGMLGDSRRKGGREPAFAYLMLLTYLMIGAFRHTIMCQFRFTLILQALLLVYFPPGVQFIAARLSRLTARKIGLACGIVGVATYAVVVAACFTDVPVLSRHMRDLSPLQPTAFGGRGASEWVVAHASPGNKVLVDPRVRDSYVILGTHRPQSEGSVIVQTVYNSKFTAHGYEKEVVSKITLTRSEIVENFRERLREVNYLLTTTAQFEVGTADGFLGDFLALPADPGESFESLGVRLVPEAAFWPFRIYRVQHDGKTRVQGGAFGTRGPVR